MSARDYQKLGLTGSAPESEVRKAYRKLALKHHPDRGGNAEAFKEIQAAYEAITNPAPPPIRTVDHRIPKVQPMRPPMRSNLSISLEQVYTGVNRRVRIQRTVYRGRCQTCEGTGSTFIVTKVSVGIGFVQKIRRRCNSCGGHGGANGVEETSEITLSVPRGAHDGFRIVMEEGDFWEQDGVRSDLIFIVKVQRHRTFERSESDLRMRTKVLLADALRGFPMEITRLDGSILSLYVSGVVSPEQRRIVPREGLFNNPDSEERGSLVLEFDIEFPSKLEPSQKDAVLQLPNKYGSFEEEEKGDRVCV